MSDAELKLLRHPLRDILDEHDGEGRVHLALARLSWDEAVELQSQLEAAHRALERCRETGRPLVMAISDCCHRPNNSFALTQALVDSLAGQAFRQSPLPVVRVRLPLEALEWAQRAVRAQLRDELPPPGLPEPGVHPMVLAQLLLSLSLEPGKSFDPVFKSDVPRAGLPEYLGYYHACGF